MNININTDININAIESNDTSRIHQGYNTDTSRTQQGYNKQKRAFIIRSSFGLRGTRWALLEFQPKHAEKVVQGQKIV